MVTVVPSPGALPIAMVPPCSSTIFLTLERPNPVPDRLVVKKWLENLVDDFSRDGDSIILE